jgi:putative membrane protein insertion efficiency factor
LPNPSPDLPAERETPHNHGAGRIKAAALIIVLLVLAWDLTREPRDQWTAWLMVQGIGLYQQRVSPGLSKAGVRCRFEPTCSHYAVASIEKYGTLEGSWRSARRLVHCGPWTEAGTLDPP